ncbi:MAG TPA: AAA family ATPase [Cyclobacteriaceae bacterium]|nr:AAA family ATPase [Cyclobacteriaceae bacterium]
MIIVVFGLPGSGKSYFASRLALHTKAEYLNSDQLRIKMFKKRDYSDEEKKAVYDALFDKAKKAAKRNTSLVIDATFYKQELRQQYLDEFDENVFFIEVVANKRLIKKRMSTTRAFSEADFKVHKNLKKEWEPFEQKHLVLESTNDNIGEMIDKAMLYLPKR